MKKIKKLDLFTSNRIAAGEVVENPSSIVKELVENSIDANSSSIGIEIESGGISKIRVSDNGFGIHEEDIPLLFERHATSKISQASDLDKIASLGFRGEALCSICAVSQVEMVTRTNESEHGMLIRVAGGQLKKAEPIACPNGTSVLVENLFYNTPARLKFLKKTAIESGYVNNIIARNILANPQISFKLINDSKIKYHSPGDGDLLTALYCIYGKETVETLKEIDFESKESNLKIHGYVSRSESARKSRKYQSFFVNGRYIQSQLLSNALQEAFFSRIMAGTFPLCAIFLELPYDEVDVNIHPHKMEVRFKDEIQMAREMIASVNQSMSEKQAVVWHYQDKQENPSIKSSIRMIPTHNAFSTQKIQLQEKNHQLSTHGQDVKKSENSSNRISVDGLEIKKKNIDDNSLRKMAFPKEFTFGEIKGKVKEAEINLYEQTSILQEQDIIIKGQVFATYIMVEQNDKLYLIDQHAAHERMIYDEMMKKTKFKSYQTLLVPYEITLSSEESALIRAEKSAFEEMGFKLEEMEGESWRILGVPQLFKVAETSDFLLEVVGAIEKNIKKKAGRWKQEYVAKFACKHSIRGNEALNEPQIKSLLTRFQQLGILNCPHGRPIMICVPKRELEKLFKRIV